MRKILFPLQNFYQARSEIKFKILQKVLDGKYEKVKLPAENFQIYTRRPPKMNDETLELELTPPNNHIDYFEGIDLEKYNGKEDSIEFPDDIDCSISGEYYYQIDGGLKLYPMHKSYISKCEICPSEFKEIYFNIETDDKDLYKLDKPAISLYHQKFYNEYIKKTFPRNSKLLEFENLEKYQDFVTNELHDIYSSSKPNKSEAAKKFSINSLNILKELSNSPFKYVFIDQLLDHILNINLEHNGSIAKTYY